MNGAKERLFSYLPSFYRQSKFMDNLFHAEGAEIDKLRALIIDAGNQQYIETATWALDLYEDLYGLPIDRSVSHEERRRRILAKKRAGTADLIEILKAVEPSLQVGFGGYVIPLYIYSNLYEYDKFGELIKLLEEWKPAVYSYSFTLAPYGYTAKARLGNRYSVAFELISGTAHAGRYPKANTRGESLHNILNINGHEMTGIAELHHAASLVSGGKGSPNSFGSVEGNDIQVKSLVNVGFSPYNHSGQYKTGQILTDSVGSSTDFEVGCRSVPSTGHSSFPCGARFSGEEVA